MKHLITKPCGRASLVRRIYHLYMLSLIACMLMTVQARAEINYNLLMEWSRQPQNVQQNLVNQNTMIRVVDEIPYYDPTLVDVIGLTTMQVYPNTMIVKSVDVQVERGAEYCLTHEVGHCISNANHSLFWWCYRPEFIAIWQQERYNCSLLVGQGSTDIREYFACAYDCYIRFNGILKICCPQTYNYMQVVLKYT